MNPIGGKLGDLLGRRNIVVIFGIAALICTVGMGIVNSFAAFAIMFPVIPLVVSIITIGINFPNNKREKVKVDGRGIICLVIFLSAMTLTLNFGSRVGWTNPFILFGFIGLIVSGVVLFKVESNVSEAVIPIYLLKNKRFIAILFIGFTCVYYQTVMKSYVPLVVQQVMNQTATVAGALQIPRTILTMVLPTIIGIWVGKKTSYNWISMALASGLAGLAFLPLIFTNASTPVMIFFVGLGITGIAESFRSISITPVAQSELEKKDLGVGTSLITFMNTLGGLVCAALSGVLFDAQGGDIQAGFRSVALVTVIISLIGCILVFVFIRPVYQHKK